MTPENELSLAARVQALSPLRDVIAAHDLGARKGLGQHFLLDLNLTARIVRAAGDIAGSTVIEVGPGPGGLSRAILCAGPRRLIAIEKDPRCLDALLPLTQAAADRFVVVGEDALAVDESALVAAQGDAAGPVHIISNLPYNVGSVLIVKWLRQIAADPARYAGITVLLQKEVAQRLAAEPRTKAYGRLSIMCQWLCDAEACFDIGPRAFTPPPKVSSTVVHMTPLPAPRAAARWDAMETVTRAAFGQRRKMLRAGLKALMGARTEEILVATGIKPTARAEELSVADFAALARAWADIGAVSAPRAAT